MSNKREKMMSFWSERAKLYKSDPRANTNDIWLRELEINYVNGIIKSNSFKRILDFGCANGHSTIRLARLNKDITFVGVDINPDMIDVAIDNLQSEQLTNLEFVRLDITKKDIVMEKYDFIFAIRVFQNIESPEMQKKIFDEIYNLLNKNGMFLYIESYINGYERLNNDRVKMALPPLPIHEHLTLLNEDFDNYVSEKMNSLSRDYLSSSYYLITRLLYSYIAKMSNDPIDYNHPIHQVATIVPQIGDYGPQKASLYKKARNF